MTQTPKPIIITRQVPMRYRGSQYDYSILLDMQSGWAVRLRPHHGQEYDAMARSARVSLCRLQNQYPKLKVLTRTLHIQGVRTLEIVRIS